MRYMIEIDDHLHDTFQLHCDNMMEGVSDAIAQWMDRYGDDLNWRRNVRLRVYEDGEMQRSVPLTVEHSEKTNSYGEKMWKITLSDARRAHLESLT
jgi:hypothetical protein